ncbi:hypothetical protein AA23498_0286 [Acetobacter nitrogenifigens DSM 23921 = NBRC 105050]|uniref:Uncharacterized protein n=2 Tax=Acetobacter TaxID=434 RepID=A0A511XE82_9PROT|nr:MULTISPECIES: hypothetical protein [Acetobacter]MBO1360636.1 hypothetical protein [Acetobacter sacchari]GBQ88085.1 hypothetical protein AA23498_0286 [Acetobacter nitrogenifigens DSM 23921 = NBRC 105050]GEN61266.1 hypothetical protein ANI02nite_31500 [Acetobacter nitrogenifigens DSM 23921 = NBRC 105050]
MVVSRRSRVLAAAALALLASPIMQAEAAPLSASSDPLAGAEITTGDPTQQSSGVAGTESRQHEHMTVRGHHSLPPGYQDAPSMDMTHGPDPDHEASVQRDSVTGSNLSHFGSSYQDNGPTGRGQLGDSTGNGWVTPR